MRKPFLPFAGLTLGALALAMSYSPAAAGDPITVTLNNQWTAIPLPETPLGVSAHNGKLWAVGANEMIAESSDNGRTWTVVNHNKPGEMLFFIGFQDQPGSKQPGYAAIGSGKRLLRSKDGGATWKVDRSVKSGESWSSGEFYDAMAGIAGSPSGWGVTYDGGKTWAVHGFGMPAEADVKPPDPKAPVPPVPLLHSPNRRVLQVAALDANDDAILLAPERGQQPIVFTKDGGKTWIYADLISKLKFHATGLRVAYGNYWLYGQNNGGVPMVLTTKDAATWTNNPPLQALYTDCTSQGCRIPGGWAQLDQPAIQLWQLPAAGAAMSPTSWAFAGGTFCQVGAGKLECTAQQTAWEKVPEDYRAPLEVDYRDLKPERWAPVERPSETYDSESDAHDGVTLLRMVIGPNGVPESVQIEGTAWGDLGKTVADELKTWHFAPVIQDERPTEVVVNLPYVLLLGMGSRTLPGFNNGLISNAGQ